MVWQCSPQISTTPGGRSQRASACVSSNAVIPYYSWHVCFCTYNGHIVLWNNMWMCRALMIRRAAHTIACGVRVFRHLCGVCASSDIRLACVLTSVHVFLF